MASLTLTKVPVSTSLSLAKRCLGECRSQCDGCHSLNNCVGADRRHGDLLLCGHCKELVTRYEGVGFPILTE